MNFMSTILVLFGFFLASGSTLKLVDPHKYGYENAMDEVTYSWKTGWTPDNFLPVDHFGYTNTQKFKIKYLYNADNYKPGGPIFFYAGNEGSIEGFANATGLMWDIAYLFNAYILFAEHRYYGESMPYPNNQSYSDISRLGYLTSAQALADYAMFLPWFKETNNMTDAPVIVFGGSYGGMLATWFRLKYPALTVGAWAASAPVTYFKGGGVDVGGFDKVVKNTYVASRCDPDLLHQAFDAITKYGNSSSGLATLNKIFKMDPATPLKTPADVTALKLYLQIGMEYMAMTDYPYPTSFLNTMPGWPVLTGCNAFSAATVSDKSDETLMTGLLALANIYYNYTGTTLTTCLDASKCGTNVNGNLDAGSPDGWDFQECTEIIIEMCSLGGSNDFFDSYCNSTNFLDFQNTICNPIYGSIGWKPEFMRVDAVKNLYGWDFSQATNIIFTNGAYDPWSAGGVNSQTPGILGGESRGIYGYLIEGSAHHLDLRQPNTCDPESVVEARRQAIGILRCWLKPNATGCPFTSSMLPGFTPPTVASTNCSYIIKGYPWNGQGTGGVTGTPDPNGSTQGQGIVTGSPVPDGTTQDSSASISVASLGLLALSVIAKIIM